MNNRSILIACLAALGLAVAGWAQADGKIAFISDREGHGDVWIMNGDGSDPVNLTQGRHCTTPAWSPDGTKIAYIYLDDYPHGQYGGEIWLMDADGGNPQQLTDDSVDKISLWWSADGSSIYYDVLGAPTDDGNLIDSFVMALDGSGSLPVDWREVPHPRRYSGRSPDGTKSAVVVLREKGDEENLARLYITNVGEDESLVIPLPDLHQSGLCVFDPEGPLPVRSDFPKGTVCVSDNTWRAGLTWSPNSMRIAFTSLTKLIWAIDIDGGNLVELTNGLGGRNPAWQPVVLSVTATSVESQSWGQIKSLLSH
ncbi:MAG: hypothetical protein F4X17_13275 [Gemmatimonadetes bacterium]|nr:hypothetical protein [Gemmatimonadota bacterium]MYI60738.1 hypothetical protein [Gemmatimonadota bacterium]